MTTHHKQSFQPIADENTRIIVFGSLPGEVSLAAHQYYANPTNQFWRLIGDVIEQDLAPLKYDRRVECLLAAHIGLWDVVASAVRQGSADAAIRAIAPNALADLRQHHHALIAFGFNGAKSAKVARKQLPADFPLKLRELPSSSAAYCAMSFDTKQRAWREIRKFL